MITPFTRWLSLLLSRPANRALGTSSHSSMLFSARPRLPISVGLPPAYGALCDLLALRSAARLLRAGDPATFPSRLPTPSSLARRATLSLAASPAIE